MSYWSVIKGKLKDPVELGTQLLLLLVGAYIFIMAEKYGLMKAPLVFMGLLCWLFFRNKTKHPIVWLVLLVLLGFDLYQFYFRVANHHFMMLLVVLSVVFYRYHKCTAILQKNIQMLLVVVLLASAFQKLMSQQFINGDFYYYLMNRAFVFDVLHPFFPETLELAKSNSESILALQNTNPNNKESIVLNNVFPNIGAISLVYAWFTIVLEFIAALAILFQPRSAWTHILFLGLILGILCTRLEMGFMGLLAICGLFLCNTIKMRLLYAMIALGCVASIVVRVGFY